VGIKEEEGGSAGGNVMSNLFWKNVQDYSLDK
jgi:hypothetical protein